MSPLRAPAGLRSFITGVCGPAPPRRAGIAALAAQHHAAKHADAEHIDPAGGEIEHVREEHRRHDVLDDQAETDPGRKPAAAEQHELGDPQGVEYDNTEEAELDADLKRQIVRVAGDPG